ncbi:MAG: hypothetical protein V2A65_00575 [Candidatus Omnitrophota bacterium]
MKTVFTQDFSTDREHTYPSGWMVENNCEHPNKLGWIEAGKFFILSDGNKHLPRIAPVRDFEIEWVCGNDRVFSPFQLLVFFRYDVAERTGYCLRYEWGIHGGKTHWRQEETERYTAILHEYRGKNRLGCYRTIAQNHVDGFCSDLAAPQRMRLEVDGERIVFRHNGRMVGRFNDSERRFDRPGLIGFDRGETIDKPFYKAPFWISRLEIKAPVNDEPSETVILKRTYVFPAEVNGMVSSYEYAVSAARHRAGVTVKTALRGGPSPDPIHPDIDRMRFNEKLTSPYIRIEDAQGTQLEKIYLRQGTVGLDRFHWNDLATAMSPADFQCPIEHECMVEKLPPGSWFFLGYEHYEAENTLFQSGGPSEMVVSPDGEMIFAGPALTKGCVLLTLNSSPDKQICSRIPPGVYNYPDARIFAGKNFFYFAGETIAGEILVLCRDTGISPEEFTLSCSVETAFKEPMQQEYQLPLRPVAEHPLNRLPGTTVLSAKLEIPGALPVGVYHLLAEVRINGHTIAAQRRTMEVMPVGKGERCAPLQSGLPAIYHNLLSDIDDEHFNPWSRSICDRAHYNSCGNNFFKVALERRSWELFDVYGRDWICFPGYIIPGDGAEKDYRELAEHSVLFFAERTPRNDLWSRPHYRSPAVFEALKEFTRRAEFAPAGAELISPERLSSRQEPGLTEEEFAELAEYHWKKWISFFTDMFHTRILPEEHARLTAMNSGLTYAGGGATYPTYASVYKSGYFPYYFGRDLRRNIDRYLPGPHYLEDYPYSSGYAIARGIYQLASLKLENSRLKICPEVFGRNGETADSHVVYANPPYGRSTPSYDFMVKQFYEYAYAACWFDRRGFHFWNDHGFHEKTWSRQDYDAMLYAYAFISRNRPVKPLRSTAFVFSLASCLAHPDYYEKNEELFLGGYVMNTAEESVAFAYEQARADGQTAGFVMKAEDLEALAPEDVDMLVLPPLMGLDEKELRAIRKLHECGVALMGFENVAGLEDLFGVRKTSSRAIRRIFPCSDTIIPELRGMTETTSHELCRSSYDCTTAFSLLTGDEGEPVLVMNETVWGKTALFTIPPTVVKRSSARIPLYGQESISTLINTATAKTMCLLGNPQVTTSAGKCIAFHGGQGGVHVIVEEDSWPHPGGKIRPLVTVRLPDSDRKEVSCDKDFAVVSSCEDGITIRIMELKEHEAARLWIHEREK